MRTLLILPVILLMLGCNCQKSTTAATAKTAGITDCPKDGDCTIRVEKNKSLVIKSNDFGKMYYELVDNSGTSVIIYEYKRRNTDPTLQDNEYREEVVFEIGNEKPEMQLTGLGLQQTKMLFGRFCFCRGATGYYKINDGTLNLTKGKNKLQFRLDFKITEVPQVITSIASETEIK